MQAYRCAWLRYIFSLSESAGDCFMSVAVAASALTQPLAQPAFHSSAEILASLDESTIWKFKMNGVALSLDRVSPSGPAASQAFWHSACAQDLTRTA